MDASVRNLLYRHPQFYELAYPEPNDETPTMCRRMFSRYLSEPPRSILDIGCGTGRDLDSLSKECSDCWGVDCLPEMIEYAKARRPHLHLQVGDMRTVRLGRTFDVIMSMGSALMYALTNADVARSLETFVAHSHLGTLLILDINNAAGYLGGDNFQQTSELHVDSPDFSAQARSTYSFDRRRQLLVRKRTWTIAGQDEWKISASTDSSFRKNLRTCWTSEASEWRECLTTCSYERRNCVDQDCMWLHFASQNPYLPESPRIDDPSANGYS